MEKRLQKDPFGKKIRIALIEQDMTSRILAEKLGMAESTLCDVIYGRNKSIGTKQKIADELDITI